MTTSYIEFSGISPSNEGVCLCNLIMYDNIITSTNYTPPNFPNVFPNIGYIPNVTNPNIVFYINKLSNLNDNNMIGTVCMKNYVESNIVQTTDFLSNI